MYYLKDVLILAMNKYLINSLAIVPIIQYPFVLQRRFNKFLCSRRAIVIKLNERQDLTIRWILGRQGVYLRPYLCASVFNVERSCV